MRRMPIRHRIAPLTSIRCLTKVLRGISRNFFRLFPCDGQVAYVLLTRAPVAGSSKQAYSPAAPRLACVKPVASVHPEPGSNSSLLYLVSLFFLIRQTIQSEINLFSKRRGLIQELTLSHKRQIIIALVLTIVYCKSFNVLFSNRRIVCGGNSLQSKLKFLKLPNFCSTFFIFFYFSHQTFHRLIC